MRHVATWLLLACILMLVCDGVGKENKTAKKVAKAVAKAATSAGKKTTRFFTAWTIISLVMLVIIISVVAYYLHMFYPLVCAERGKYDVMEMAHV